MSGPLPNVAYMIINTRFGPPVALHLSDSDNMSIVTNVPNPTNPRQSWIVQQSGDDTFTLQSSFNYEQSIGFEGALVPGVNLIAGDSSVAQGFVFQPVPVGPDNYTVLLAGPPFAITMSSPGPGNQVQLLPLTGRPNQIWMFEPVNF